MPLRLVKVQASGGSSSGGTDLLSIRDGLTIFPAAVCTEEIEGSEGSEGNI